MWRWLYPPGYFSSCDATPRWCAAIVIFSVSENMNTPGTASDGGQGNNDVCGGDIEYANFAFIQTDGVPFPPGSPSPLGPFVALNAKSPILSLAREPRSEEPWLFASPVHGSWCSSLEN
jgi:hypothetical protein